MWLWRTGTHEAETQGVMSSPSNSAAADDEVIAADVTPAAGAIGGDVVAAGTPVIGTSAAGTVVADGARAGVGKLLVMPSTKSDQDGVPWSFSSREYHWLAAPFILKVTAKPFILSIICPASKH